MKGVLIAVAVFVGAKLVGGWVGDVWHSPEDGFYAMLSILFVSMVVACSGK